MSNIVFNILSEKYCELGGKIFAEYLLRVKGDDDVKKSLQANDFLLGMLNGNIKQEWKLEDTEDFKDFVELAKAINKVKGN